MHEERLNFSSSFSESSEGGSEGLQHTYGMEWNGDKSLQTLVDEGFL